MNKKLFVCLVLFYGFVFGNQPGHYLVVEKQSVFIPDRRNETLRQNGIALNNYYSFLKTEISNMQLSEPAQMRKTQSDARRVSLSKIALESAGAATGGFSAWSITHFLFRHTGFWEGLMTCISVPIGTAGGATFMGNLLIEPNGSFIKSLRGSAIGTVVGLGFVTIAGLTGTEGTWDHLRWNPKTISYICLIIAALSPVSGAVIGYNQKEQVVVY